MRQNIAKNVTAFAICIGVIVGTFLSATPANAAEGPAAPSVPAVSVSASLAAALQLDVLGLVDLSLALAADVQAGVTL